MKHDANLEDLEPEYPGYVNPVCFEFEKQHALMAILFFDPKFSDLSFAEFLAR